VDIIPIMKREQDGAIITQFDYPTCEALGLVKMDFLGLRNLTVLGDAVRNVSRSRGVDLDLDALGADPTDPAAYELLSRGDTLGVFQLDGTGTRTLLRLMRPKRIQDIMATIALYRPGPMGINSHTNYALRRSGQQQVTYPHPEVVAALEPVLAPNYGLIVYQEDVIEAARLLAGYTLGRADMLRRAMGKKKKEVLDAEYVPFASGMSERGFSAEAIAAVWDALLPFADYGFGKAHAAAYAQVSYWTAYLKANYPAEYMAAVLTSVKDDKDKMAVYLAECRRMGINVLPPCVNSSEADFTPVGGDIRFGLTAVRNVGSNVVASVVDTRTAKGGFTDFGDYLRKVDAVVCNKRTIEGLIKGGAFDSLGHTRRGLMNVFEAAVDAVLDTKRAEAMGQFDLFGSLDGPDSADTVNPVDDVFAVRVPDGEWDKKVLLQFEREMLGLYVSDHPLFGLEHVLSAAADSSIAAVQADAAAESQKLTLTGILTGVNRRVTKAGSPWASATLEDLDGSIEVMFFPSTYAKVALDVVEDAIVAVKGHTDAREDSMKFVASDLTQLDTSNPAARGPVKLRLDATRCTPPLVDRLKDVLATHPGSTEVHLHLVSTNNPEVVLGSRVNPTAALMGDLKALLGPAAVSA
jgi:DNA polymerase-3 subunit alpha